MGEMLGRTIALPEDARPDLAYQKIVNAGARPLGLVFLHTVPDGVYEIVQAATFRLQTSTHVSDRFPAATVLDQDGHNLWYQVGNGSQPASTLYDHTFLLDAGGSYFAGSGNSITVLPYAILLPGWRFDLFAYGMSIDDQIMSASLTLLVVPNGPARAPLAPPALPVKV